MPVRGLSATPVAVAGLTGATAISGSCALLAAGTVQCWGWNESGQLGDGTTTGPESCADASACSTTPVAVSGLTGVTSVSAGGETACVLLAAGTVQCWGDNTLGQLGNGTTIDSKTPAAVQ
jgi:alpha-tubulin suppressor-like RCC1 family protein